ncbi:hypothetical protein GCM10010349_03570 [Streptomyces flavofungini]|nr:hypothetical protein GCM10010349_03570 [Streptomyces flavofungini]
MVAEATTDGRLTGCVRHQIRHVSTCSSLTAPAVSHLRPEGKDSTAPVFMDPNAQVGQRHPGS